MSVVRDSALTFAARVVIFVLQGIAALLLARFLGPQGRGLYALIVTLPHVAAMLANLGATPGIAFSVSSGRLKSGKGLALAVLFPLTTGALAVLVLEAAAPLYLRFYPEVPPSLFRLAVLLIPFIAGFNNLLGFFQGTKRFEAFNGLNVANPLIFLAVFVGWTLLHSATISGAIFSWQAGFAGAAVLGFLWARSHSRLDFGLRLDDLRGFLRYSSRISLNEIFTFLNYRLDIFLVGYFLDARAVGLYAVAVVVAETLWFLASSAANVLFPRFAERPLSEAAALLRRAFAAVFWISLLLVVFLWLVDDLLIRAAFGRNFLPSVAALNYLYPGVLALSLYKVLASFMASRGFPGAVVQISGTGVLVNLAANLLLIPRLGIRGAALASSLSYGLMFCGALSWFLRKHPGNIPLLFRLETGTLRKLWPPYVR